MMQSHLLTERILQLSNALEQGLYERQHVVRLCLLAALCGESVFLYGPPGIAKSLIARRIKYAFRHSHVFEYLMTRFSTPEEIFGPLSIQALKDEGRYQRLTKGYLPDAGIVFLDEIWKAGPAILNTLLTAINERRFRNGDSEETIPMRLLVTASNELPEANSGLEALYDRMLIRLRLENVQEKMNFRNMLSDQQNEGESLVPESLRISDEEYQTWQSAITQIVLPEDVFGLIWSLRQRLNSLTEFPGISDRRWKKALRLLQACAFYSGRQAIVPIDLILLKDCLWSDAASRQQLENEIDLLMTQQAWQQQTMQIKLHHIKSHAFTLQQQHQQQRALKLNRYSSTFGRKTRYELPSLPEISGDDLILYLQQPLFFQDIQVTHVEINRDDLSQWLQKNGEIQGRLNGTGFPRRLDLQTDGNDYLVIRDASLQESGLMLPVISEQQAMPEEIVQALDQLDIQLQAQRSLFAHHQRCPFISNDWLIRIETSLQTVADQLAQARSC